MDTTVVTKHADAIKAPQEWGELTWFANAELGNSEELTVGKCVIKPGQANPLHMHPNCSEVLIVMDGVIEHVIEDGKVARMEAGDSISIPANFYHNAKNVGDKDAILFISFSSAHRKTQGE